MDAKLSAAQLMELENKHGAHNYHPVPVVLDKGCLLYTSPSPRDRQKSRMPSSA